MLAADPDARPRGGLKPTLFTLGAVMATALIYGIPTAIHGRRCEDRRQFLRDYRAPNEFEAYTYCAVAYCLESTESNDFLILGDSAARADIGTIRLERATGLRGYNLGTVGLIGIDGYHQILRAYLAHHPAPRALIFSVLPTLPGQAPGAGLPEEYAEIRRRFLWCYGPGDGVARPSRDSWLYHSREGIRAIYGSLRGGVGHFSDEPMPFNGPTLNAQKRALLNDRGFTEFRRTLKSAGPARPPEGRGDFFEVTEEFSKGLDALIRTADEHRIRLVIRFAPAAALAPGPTPRLRAWADGLEAGHPGLTVARPEVVDYPADDFNDANHLNDRGAAKFTALVAGDLKEALANPAPGAK